MNLTIIAVGKLKERFWVDACAEYAKRLTPYLKLAIHEVPDFDPAKCGGVEGSLKKEGSALLGAIPREARVILLDIEGKKRSSEGLSRHIDQLALQGISDVAFIIGGSNGVSGEVRQRADETLSFGPVTLPHNLARVVLLEQVYRACKISRGEPYHK